MYNEKQALRKVKIHNSKINFPIERLTDYHGEVERKAEIPNLSGAKVP